ncbi:NUDIX hydrolase [Ketobacter sp. MCCC 1A13808]|uniref:NUDIX hydrolase n=1 Tax=Ketobacter sp. MCCC 1A13808 TaxID=2602738 RepID=UPI000F10DD51|nr:NUDIX hydrolase [Ketobacter sp. MCCC 1A13808]MVF13869.1 NUDIX hydrolase [Ketobacter sp. MCCC 1A13808]RLP54920.1 MAG: NUDIX domain-containing protein [Ketobacter sp.]
MEDSWLKMAKRLQALAVTGSEFTRDPFDRERYQEISHIATTMLGQLGQVPVTRILGLVGPMEKGYVTPKVEVRGALIEDDKILLVHEKEDGRWTLPGGYADVGLSAAESVEKEVFEEAGIKVKARYLYALRHKAKWEYDPDTRDFYKLYFLCEREHREPLQHGPETLDARFFARNALPELSTGRVLPRDLLDAWDFYTLSSKSAQFD